MSLPIFFVCHLRCSSERDKEFYEILEKAASENGHFKVYTGDTILQRWHANNTQRMGPILAVADMGWAFQDMYLEAEWYRKAFNVTCTCYRNNDIIFIYIFINIFCHQ